ncbi:DNA-binding transcriptional regulator, LysR family [Palleronia marisminoris]|uniref:HTH-type transcriptional regulator CysB n=1 Tax=Palleronia marisminoris TaxID=315423 RepID=A0A1Y5RMI9_9RHOB|nr:LysR substrate-binding domain-containing protein [Palleronia marisminoris]SFG28064.1 DNA-binding transcriptional regulator, LysR family [Palleronia marisminoris]SLN20921.1 HTH-type transcriptional regulator CysB [Palleronia marisminoris]
MTLRFTLRQLTYFVAVGELGSIALAAGRVNVSSPSISAAITQLEAEFGLQLFARKHAQGLALTQAGRQFLVQAKSVLSEAERLNGLANEIAGQVRGPLHVGCLLTFAQIVLPHVRRSFAERFPDVQFRQFERDQQAIIDGLRNAELDIALTYDLEIPPDLEFVPLFNLPPYAILPDMHDLANRHSVSVRELAPYPMVLLDLPHSGRYFLSFFGAAGIEPNVVERTRDMEVMKSLVANGFGYSIANIRHSSERAADGKRLRFVPLEGDARPMRMGMLVMSGAKSALAVRALIDHCKENLTPELTPGLKIQKVGYEAND